MSLRSKYKCKIIKLTRKFSWLWLDKELIDTTLKSSSIGQTKKDILEFIKI